MHLYEVSDSGDRRVFAEKLTDAHSVAKLMPDRKDSRIRLFDYPDDKAAFCGLFNGRKPQGTFLRAWALTTRGGLMELPADKARREFDDELSRL